MTPSLPTRRSSDLSQGRRRRFESLRARGRDTGSSVVAQDLVEARRLAHLVVALSDVGRVVGCVGIEASGQLEISVLLVEVGVDRLAPRDRSEEHTSELQSLMRLSYAVFCFK